MAVSQRDGADDDRRRVAPIRLRARANGPGTSHHWALLSWGFFCGKFASAVAGRAGSMDWTFGDGAKPFGARHPVRSNLTET